MFSLWHDRDADIGISNAIGVPAQQSDTSLSEDNTADLWVTKFYVWDQQHGTASAISNAVERGNTTFDDNAHKSRNGLGKRKYGDSEATSSSDSELHLGHETKIHKWAFDEKSTDYQLVPPQVPVPESLLQAVFKGWESMAACRPAPPLSIS